MKGFRSFGTRCLSQGHQAACKSDGRRHALPCHQSSRGLATETTRCHPDASAPLRILGLESSADDTCAAIVDSEKRILANVVLKQQDLLERWGGIHPFHATSRHQKNMAKSIRQCLDEAGLSVSDMDAIAYTRGPGMPACLASCSLAAKTLSAAYEKPLIGVHHMQAHALTVGLTEDEAPAYPYLTLLVSGGHTLLVLAEGPFDMRLLATSTDDSIGDAFDKVARMLDIPFNGASSGGEALEKYISGVHPSPSAFANLSVPSPGELRFSYSGLKSAVKRYLGPDAEPNGTSTLPDGMKRELAAAFQAMAVRQLEEKTTLALKAHTGPRLSSLVISGGVASNVFLRRRMRECLDNNGGRDMRLLYPPISLCTDNAVMIAWTAFESLRIGRFDTFDSPLRPKWSIEDCRDLE